MKDRLLYGLFPGLSAPFIIILLFWLFRFHDLPLSQFIHQAIALKVQFKLISVGVFFADLGLFYLFLHLNKNNASKGVILAVLIYFLSFSIFQSFRSEKAISFLFAFFHFLRFRHPRYPNLLPFSRFFLFVSLLCAFYWMEYWLSRSVTAIKNRQVIPNRMKHAFGLN